MAPQRESRTNLVGRTSRHSVHDVAQRWSEAFSSLGELDDRGCEWPCCPPYPHMRFACMEQSVEDRLAVEKANNCLAGVDMLGNVDDHVAREGRSTRHRSLE
jgi:hypothetical protein